VLAGRVTEVRVKAAVYDSYGSPEVVHLDDVAKPVPGDHEVLIKVHAASVNSLDCLTAGKPYSLRLMTGLRRPKVTRLGVDVAGEVEAAGRKVTGLVAGDQVLGMCLHNPQARGVAAWMQGRGAFAEYACAHEQAVAAMPGNVTFEQAAAAPVAAITALQGLRDKGRVQAGQQVLVNGAAGGVGTFAVQIAKWLGAEVTGVCSTGHAGLVRSAGADRVIDYTREDFTQGEQRYDVLFDLIGNHSVPACSRVLNPAGTYIAAGGPGSRWLIGLIARPAEVLAMSQFTRRKLVTYLARPDHKDLMTISELMATGKVTPVIDRCYALSDTGPALRYLEEKHAGGKVVIDLG
jgi:NADPH:quinone reductase-like Zn-dependent oxidoreductase